MLFQSSPPYFGLNLPVLPAVPAMSGLMLLALAAQRHVALSIASQAYPRGPPVALG
ncbi:hypothetical protein GGQ88_003719 [Novosphingobium hassiacum]|uniref:Uncharacterized protein n=1 Tax=Novosphingobium hassiacum TaxID=173676 RepID=A0A7W6A082_9SPHN|nr:hypothetical protein [Novosphingobium hassiacum]